MRFGGPFSPEAMKNLVEWIPLPVRQEAWRRAHEVYVARDDGSDGPGFAEKRADRFWPNYLTDKAG